MSETIPPKVSRKSDAGSDSSRRTSMSTSTRSQESASHVQISKSTDGLPTPESPSFRVTRKRAASVVIRDVGDTMEVDHVSPTHTWVSSGDSRDSTYHLCLCQPDPKIPRPRNGRPVVLCLLPLLICCLACYLEPSAHTVSTTYLR